MKGRSLIFLWIMLGCHSASERKWSFVALGDVDAPTLQVGQWAEVQWQSSEPVEWDTVCWHQIRPRAASPPLPSMGKLTELPGVPWQSLRTGDALRFGTMELTVRAAFTQVDSVANRMAELGAWTALAAHLGFKPSLTIGTCWVDLPAKEHLPALSFADGVEVAVEVKQATLARGHAKRAWSPPLKWTFPWGASDQFVPPLQSVVDALPYAITFEAWCMGKGEATAFEVTLSEH